MSADVTQNRAGGAQAGAHWALEATTDNVILVDREFRITFINRAAARLNGVAPESVLGKTIWEQWPANLGTDIERNYRKAMAEGVPVRFVHGYFEPGKFDLWLEIHAYPSPDGLAIFFHDVSDAKREAARVADDRERLASAMRATDLGFWRCNLPLDDHPFDWSPQVRRHFGISDAERVGVKEFLGLLHPDDRQTTADAMQRAIEGHVPYDVVYRTLGRDGKTRWIRATGNAFYREDGTPYRFDGFTVELTERLMIEKALQEREAMLRASLDASVGGFYSVDGEGNTTLCNPAFLRMLGFGRMEDAVGRKLHDVIHHTRPNGSHYPKEECPIYRAARGGPAVHVEDELFFRLDGTSFPVEYWTSPILVDGEVQGAVTTFMDVTERHAAEAALRESEAHYRTLFDSIDQGFCTFETIFDDAGRCVDYRFLEVNHGFEEQTGLTKAAALGGQTMREMVPAHEQKWYDLYGRVALTGQPARIEDHAEALGRHYEVHAFRIGGEGSREVGALFKDISERRGIEEERERLLAELTVEQGRLRSLFQKSPSAIAVLRGEDLRFEYANEVYLALFTRGEAVAGKTVAEALPEADEQGFGDLLRNVMATGVPFRHAETAFTIRPTHDQPARTVYVDFVYQPIHEADGTVSSVFAHIVDITDQVLARQAIARSQELFRTVFEQAPDDAILVMDLDRNVTAWNPAAERITGWSAEEAIGAPADLIFTPEDRASGAPLDEAETASRNGKTDDERWHMKKDGSRFWGSGTMNSLHDAEANVRGYLKVFRDATERYEAARIVQEMNHELEAKVADRTAQLQAAIKEAEGFNYSVAHDLRSPLRTMVSTSSILLEELGPSLDEEHRSLLVRQKENALRLGRLIDELLRLSRLARAEVKREGLDMTAMARSVFEDLEEHGRTSGCTFLVQEGMAAQGDAGLVRTVLHNLVGNACKFSPRGGTIRMRQQEGAFALSDEGVGFDMAYASKVFLPFERLVSEAEFEGTGIGLANVERIVRRHGGRVWVESEPGRGTTFFFTLE